MRQLKTFLVVNPSSANGATGRRFPEILAEVRRAIGEVAHAFTDGPMQATHLTRKALEEGYELVVAVGGDGTVNEVVNGFLEDGKPLRAEAMLGIVPRGTGGAFRRVFGWSTRLDEAAARLRGEAWTPVDVGRIEFAGHDGARRARYFVNVASAGVSGLVDWEVNRASKLLGGKASFVLGTLRAMHKYRDRRLRVAFDDEPARELDATVLAVANGQFFGGGMWIAPDARHDDGVFDVTLWSGYQLRDFVLKGRAIYSGRHVDFPNTKRFRARRLRIEADEPVLIDVDGEQPGLLPVTIEILPGLLRLKVAPAD